MAGERIDDDSIELLRLVFDPADFRDGKLKGAHFTPKDLLARPHPRTGGPYYISGYRGDCLHKAGIDQDIEGMTKDGRREKDKRLRDLFAILTVGAVRQCKAADNTFPFEVRSEPEEHNLCHCGIHNEGLKPAEEDEQGYIDFLRTELLALIGKNFKRYEEVFPAEEAGVVVPQ